MDNQWNTIDGRPPMTYPNGTTNVITSQMSMLGQNQPQMSMMPQYDTSQVAQSYAQQTNPQMNPDDITSSLEYKKLMQDAQKKIALARAYKESGVFDSKWTTAQNKHPILSALAQGMMAYGQGLSHQPFLTDFMSNQAGLQKQSMEMMNNTINRPGAVPLIQIGADGQINNIGNVPHGTIVKQAPQGTMTAEQLSQTAQSLIARNPNGTPVLAPSQIPARGGQRIAAINAARALDPTYSPVSADTEFSVNRMGAGSFEKNFNNLDSFHRDFEKNSDYLLKLSSGFDRSSLPIINKAIMTGATQVQGNPKATQIVQAINTVANGYARLQNPTLAGQALSDSARDEAQNLVNQYMSDGQLNALLDPTTGSMRIDAMNRISAAQEVRDRLKGVSSLTPTQQTNNATGSMQKIGRFQVQVH